MRGVALSGRALVQRVVRPPAGCVAASAAAGTSPASRRPPSRRPGSGLDFAEVPEGARRPDVLVLDGTYLACCLAPYSTNATHAASLAATVAKLVGSVQPRVTVAAFDSGSRKALVPGSVDARRAARDTATSYVATRGEPSRFRDALAGVGVHTLVAPHGTQGDDVLTSLAHTVRLCDSLRCLVVSGDTDAVASLRRGPPGATVDWLRVAPFPCAAWPQVLTHVTWHDFLHRWKFPPQRWSLYGALVGRPRDGVHKLKGVGPSAAAALLRAFGPDPGDSDAAVLGKMLAAAQAGKLKGYRPEVGAALGDAAAAAVLAANLARLAPKLHAADGGLPAELEALVAEHMGRGASTG